MKAFLSAVLYMIAFLVFLYALLTLVLAELPSNTYAAVRVDPSYATAWLLVSLCLSQMAKFVSSDSS
jgi:hypothetical protein